MGRRLGLLVLLTLAATTSGCLGAQHPLRVQVADSSLQASEAGSILTVEMSVHNVGDEDLVHATARVNTAVKAATGSSRFGGTIVNRTDNLFHADDRLPSGAARNFTVAIQFPPPVRADDYFEITFSTEARDQERVWSVILDECWTLQGRRFTDDWCGQPKPTSRPLWDSERASS